MHPDPQAGRNAACPRRVPAQSAGFGLVAALCLLMVLAALGAFVLVIGSTQHSTAMQAVQSARARQAAMAGLDWAYYQALRNGSCASTTPLAFGGALAGFQVTASCIPAGTYREDGRVVTAYRVSAIAHRGTPGRVDYVERQLQANLWR